MLIPDHPHDERLSALASGDPEATADATLNDHLASCERCTDMVAELSALRASLAELPDLRPHRPLRLLPEVADPAPSRADRLGGWARRFFAPALAAGAAVAMVGLVGTAAPAFQGMAGGGDAAAPGNAAQELQRETGAILDSLASAPAGAERDGFTAMTDAPEAEEPRVVAATDDATPEGAGAGGSESTPVPPERSPWPMVLFSGVAIMVAAALLRWILAPRAG